MSTDNRTLINDCEANTGWSGDDTANPISTAGSFVQGSGGLSTQLSNGDEHMFTTQDSVGAGTFSLDWSDSTLYMVIKDNLGAAYSAGGIQFVVSDGTDTIGYDVAGNDAAGMPYRLGFSAFKLDVSEAITTPGGFTNFSGTEANLNQAAATGIGYGSIHLAKAVGSIDNVIMDGFYHIANDSYALTVNGGTIGTPETMADVATDDVTNGWALVTNPLGTQYQFFGPTEWGESAAAADHYFTAIGEQWYWIGDNAGGRAIATTHMPFRVTANATDAGSFVITNVAIVSTGTSADFDCSNTEIDILEIDTCSMSGLETFSSPTVGGTSRFCTSTIFSGCGVITHNGADMGGCTILSPTVAADVGSLSFNLATDPDTVMDGMTFEMGAASHHAIDFGTSVTSNITLRNCNFEGFGSTDDANDSTVRFLATTGSLNLSLVGCTVNGVDASAANFSVDDAAGIAVSLIISPVTVSVTTIQTDGTVLVSAGVMLAAADGTGPFPFEEVVTSISRSGSVATVAHTGHGMASNDKVLIRGVELTEPEYIGVKQITFIDANSYSYTVSGTPVTPATGTITSTFVALQGTTDGATGVLSTTRVYPSDQPVVGWTRKMSGAPYYKEGILTGAISSSTGYVVSAVMPLDQ